MNIGLHMPETFGYITASSPGFGVFAYEANGVKEDGLFTEETFRLPDEYKDHTLLMINNTDFITSPFRSFNNRK